MPISFTLADDFIDRHAGQQPDWGPVGYVTYKRTYARDLDKIHARHTELAQRHGLVGNEEFWLTLVRVVEGVFSILRDHCRSLHLPWSDERGQEMAQQMYSLMWEFKFLPPGRGLWMMGTPAVDKVGGGALNNCGFTSSANIDSDFSDPFCALMDFSMLGVGVGGDTRGAGKVTIQQPVLSSETHYVEDSREGWVDVLRILLDSFVGECALPTFDYSRVREAGSAIKGFGGTASGPGPLREMHDAIHTLLLKRVGQPITSSDIVDIFNLVGRCVVAGNIRRSAEIMFGDILDEEFLELKDREKNAAALDSHRWASNNSVFAEVGQSYSKHARMTAKNGEPGYFWLDNARKYGRMIDSPDFRDMQAVGSNPCQPAWATVLTPDGIRTIADIDAGSTIWSGREWTKVTKKWSTGEKLVRAYHTRAGTFYGTENHRVLQHGERIEVGSAEAIDTCQGPVASERVGSNFGAGAFTAAITDGLVLGDGTYHGASRRVFLCAGDDEVIEYRSQLPQVGAHRPGVNTHAYEVDSMFGMLPLTYERVVPTRYLHARAGARCAFLRGLYTANGSVVANRVTLKAASFTIIEQVQQMLSSLGIRSYYTVNKAHDVEHHNGVYTSRQTYDLNIGAAPDRALFARTIGFIQKHKNDRLAATLDAPSSTRSPKSTYDIVDVEDLGVEEVFDLTVEADEHTYWTGGLLVSNCNEQTLFDRELCNLVETFPFHHKNLADYKATLKFAYLYAKAVTLVPTHDARTNAVTMKNRRIGCSMSGIVQAMQKFGRRRFIEMCDKAYAYILELDKEYSSWLCVPESIKRTSVKPSGTVSLLPRSVTPGIHHPLAEYYWRVIRFATDSAMLPALRVAGYRCIEIDPAKEPNTTAVYFPVKQEGFERAASEVSMWEQLEIAAMMQAHWADNQVSVTVTFDKKTEGPQIGRALELYEARLKGVSFLPHEDHGYDHAPYQPITEAEYNEAISTLHPLDLSRAVNEAQDKFCDGDKCVLPML